MQVIMNGKLIPVFVLAALMSCSQPPVKEQGPRPVKLAEVSSSATAFHARYDIDQPIMLLNFLTC